MNEDKRILIGNDVLVDKKNWVQLSEMNTDMKILEHPMFDECFEKILKLHTPKHDIAFMSLCTKTRPYHKGRKWRTFRQLFKGNADLIVTSSGGVIPMDYWNSYPYLNYDGDSHPSADTLYIETLVYRVDKFFRTHKYKHIVANFRPALRNTQPLKDLFLKLKQENVIDSYIFTPDEALYEDIKSRGFPAGKVFPDLDEKVLDILKEEIGQPTEFDLF